MTAGLDGVEEAGDVGVGEGRCLVGIHHPVAAGLMAHCHMRIMRHLGQEYRKRGLHDCCFYPLVQQTRLVLMNVLKLPYLLVGTWEGLWPDFALIGVRGYR